MSYTQLDSFLTEKAGALAESSPVFFDLTKPTDRLGLEALIKNGLIQHVVDDYAEQLKEYFQICHPDKVYTSDFTSLFEIYYKELEAQMPLWQQGRWVFYQWESTLVHILEEDAFFLGSYSA